ncbi:MAG: molybdopterin-dependent oxidoreductase [Chloroflexi bacterium]|nr:molybdopterin-dependent oxidoreductase [Chloroflexota bacterium]
MEESKFRLTRRNFLKSSAMVGGGLVIASQGIKPVITGLAGLGLHVPWYNKGQIRTTYNYCDLCPWRCGVIVKSVNGRVYKIDGNPKDPKSRGMLCGRGQAGVSFLYDPDRLKQPMIRTGERGAGQFRNATWEDALDFTAAQLLKIREQHGPEAVAFLGHTSGDFWFIDYLSQPGDRLIPPSHLSPSVPAPGKRPLLSPSAGISATMNRWTGIKAAVLR